MKNYQANEPTHFGNGWGFYVDIENYHYNLNEYTNKVIKRNRIYNNDYGDKYDYDYDYEPDYIYKPIIKDERKEATNTFIKFTSATLITATVSFMIFYMS